MNQAAKKDKPNRNSQNQKVYDQRKTVLLVEDDSISAFLMEELLQNFHHNKSMIDYNHVISGHEAIDFCKDNKVDLVLMDIKLGDSNGIDISRQIKKTKPHLAIVAQSAYCSDDIKKEAYEVGCNDYLTKPISLKEFENILDKYL